MLCVCVLGTRKRLVGLNTQTIQGKRGREERAYEHKMESSTLSHPLSSALIHSAELLQFIFFILETPCRTPQGFSPTLEGERLLDKDLRLNAIGIAAIAVADVGVDLGVVVVLLPEPCQVAAVAQQVEGQAEPQQAQAQQPHIDLGGQRTHPDTERVVLRLTNSKCDR